MSKAKVVLNFTRIPVASKIEICKAIMNNLQGNPHFPEPDVSLTKLEAQNNMLAERHIAAMDGGKQATALLRQTEAEWDELMRKTARYVDRVADGDETLILNAGFNLAKQRGPTNRSQFEVKRSEKSGAVYMRRYIIAGARAYVWQYCIGEQPVTNDNEWTTAEVTTRASVELNGLTLLTRYWFRCAAVTAQGVTAYTAPVMLIVL